MTSPEPAHRDPPGRSASTLPPLEVIVAESAGTCFGVEAAIELAETRRKPILGPLVHNPKVVSDLAAMGIPIYERFADLETLPPDVEQVVITAHGYPRHLKEELKHSGIDYLDATCPVLLRWVYGKIARFERQGMQILLVGNPDHAEIVATKSYGKDIWVAYTREAIDGLPDCQGPMVAICQTTITQEEFLGIVEYARQTRYPHLRAVDTRCKPVRNQQEAVESLAAWVDAMLIIGGFNSSNTTKLANIARRFLPQQTYHVDDPAGIRKEWLSGIQTLGVGAGTSTPKEQIAGAKERIAELYEGPVLFHTEQRDGLVVDDPAMDSEL